MLVLVLGLGLGLVLVLEFGFGFGFGYGFGLGLELGFGLGLGLGLPVACGLVDALALDDAHRPTRREAVRPREVAKGGVDLRVGRRALDQAGPGLGAGAREYGRHVATAHRRREHLEGAWLGFGLGLGDRVRG